MDIRRADIDSIANKTDAIQLYGVRLISFRSIDYLQDQLIIMLLTALPITLFDITEQIFIYTHLPW